MRSLAPLLSLFALTACAPVADDTAALDLDGLEGLSVDAKGANKVDVCHVQGNGTINLLNVSQNAVAAHIAHGDHLAGTFYLDADGDGQGDTLVSSPCQEPGYVDNDDDCDDGDPAINTEAEEVCGDGIDDDCDGQVDEDCTVDVEIIVNADNAVWGWVDGDPMAFDFTQPHWYHARSAVMTLDSGEDHAFAFYVEDWGGLTYFSASIRVDGQVVATTGHGDFATAGQAVPRVNEWPRIAAWADVPDDAGDWPNLLFSPGQVWGDWMQVGFDDSAWRSDTTTCAWPNYWNAASFANNYGGYFVDLHADGALFVTHDLGNGCVTANHNGQAYRIELGL